MPSSSPDLQFTVTAGDVYREKGFISGCNARFTRYRIHVHYVLQNGNGLAIIEKNGPLILPDFEASEILIWTAEGKEGLITYMVYDYTHRNSKSQK